MIGTLRKHQQWLWMLIITVTIISFVIWFSPDAKWKGMSSRDNRKHVNGRPVTINGQPIVIEDYDRALRETFLASFMRTGGREWPANDEATQKRLEMDSIYRVFLIKKMQEMEIHISDKAVAQAARERLGEFGVNRFEQEYLRPHGLNIQDFERYLRHDLGIQQLISTAAVSGKLFNPQEGEKLFRKEHEQNETRVAVFWASNYLDKVTITPDDLAKYYTNRQAEYRIPDRVVVNYVEFPATNFLAEADKLIAKQTNFNAYVDDYYYKQGTNFFKGTNGAVLPEAEAKKKIKEDIRQEFALREARKKATEFGNALYNLPQPDRAENLQKQAQADGLVVKLSPPLERFTTNETEFSKEVREAAFKLTKDLAVGFNPVRGETAYYVMAFKEKIPTEIQSFEKVKDRATEDYKRNKALELARNAGLAFYSSATNGLAQKKTWDQITVDNRVTSIQPPLFSSATSSLTNVDERIKLSTLQQLAADLKPGEVSRFTPTPAMSPEGGLVLYLKDKLPVDEPTLKKELPEYLGRMRAYRQNEAFNQWFRKQAEQSKLYVAPSRETTGISGG